MRQMLLSFLSKERRHAVKRYITRAELNNDSAIIEEPEKGTKEVTIQEAGALLACAVTVRLCQEATPFREEPIVPFAWLCLAQDGLGDPLVGTVLESAEAILASQWGTRSPGRTRSKMFRSILRPNPPAIVILSGEETPTSNATAHQMAKALIRQQMISPYAESIVRVLNNNLGWLRDEKRHNPHTLRRLERLVVRDVSAGNLQPHAVVIFDGDNLPEPIEETVDVVLALTCMSEETQRHPALQGHRKNLFTVVAERG